MSAIRNELLANGIFSVVCFVPSMVMIEWARQSARAQAACEDHASDLTRTVPALFETPSLSAHLKQIGGRQKD